MTHIPALRDELTRAANRAALKAEPRPRMRRSLLVTTASVATLALAGTGTAVVVLSGVVGGRPTSDVKRVPGEERVGMTRTSIPTVAAVATVPTVGKIELVTYTVRGYRGHGTLTCFDLAFPNRTRSGSCDTALPGRAAGVVSYQPPNGVTSRLAVGLAEADTTRVMVSYRDKHRLRTVLGAIARIPASLGDRIGTGASIYYFAPIPPSARATSATGLDQRGTRLWRAQFVR